MANAVKVTFVNGLLAKAKILAEVDRDLREFYATYFDRGYNSGGADPIIDDDISSLNVTATEAADMITLMEQLQKFFDNQAVTQADYDATLNKFRRDI
jgi:hypothetical protein